MSELSKDVSAFANSAGGTIIYGVKENQKDKRLPDSIDTGYDPKAISREWLEQVISSRVHQRIDGLRIKQISLSGARAGKVIYVVYVPQSFRTPHMADDKKFYKRYNFRSVPMEEYEVRDMYGRQEAPNLEIFLRLKDEPFVRLTYPDASYSAPIDVAGSITNESPAPADYAVIDIFVDSSLRIDRFPQYDSITSDFELQSGVRTVGVTLLQMNWGVNNGKSPLWDGIRFAAFEPSLLVSIPHQSRDYLIGWWLSAPRMRRKGKFYVLRPDDQLQSVRLVGVTDVLVKT